MKTCKDCKEEKPFTEYYFHRKSRGTYLSRCKPCHNAWKKRHYKKNVDKITVQRRSYNREYKQRNSEHYKAYQRKYRRANLGLMAAHRAKYEAAKIRATPTWLTEDQISEMKNLYIARPKGYHVDHIVPLRGKTVCGLHVPWNLQHLTASENCSKNNRV